MLTSGFLKACSIGFQPIKWTYNKARDGIDFAEISLIEISAVTLPCDPNAVLDGSVKALASRHYHDRQRRELKLKAMRLRASL
jgi:phage head maturation protease